MPRDKRRRGARKKLQQKVKRYQKDREDLQLGGVIGTVPVGAARDERVDPATQRTPPSPGLIAEAVRSGWATEDVKKPALVRELIEVIEDPETEPHVKVAAFRALQVADKDEWERRNPELAGKARGSTNVQVNNQNNNTVQVDFLALARAAVDRPDPLEEAKQRILNGGTSDGDGEKQEGGREAAEPDRGGDQKPPA